MCTEIKYISLFILDNTSMIQRNTNSHLSLNWWCSRERMFVLCYLRPCSQVSSQKRQQQVPPRPLGMGHTTSSIAPTTSIAHVPDSSALFAAIKVEGKCSTRCPAKPMNLVTPAVRAKGETMAVAGRMGRPKSQ